MQTDLLGIPLDHGWHSRNSASYPGTAVKVRPVLVGSNRMRFILSTSFNKRTYLSGHEGMEASTILHSTQSRKIREDGSLTFYRPPPLLSFHVANASKCQKNLASVFKRPMYGRAMSFSQSTQRAKRRISRPTDVLRIQNAAIAQRRNGCHCGKHLEHGPVTAEAKLFPTCWLYLHKTNQTSYQIMDAIIRY